MRFLTKSGLFILAVFLFISCSANIQTNSVPEVKNNIIAEFEGEQITVTEFESAFQKVGIPKKENKADSLKEKEKFLDLYVTYKMKLKDAALKGLEKDPAVIKEYEDYRQSIGASMLVEKEVTSKAVKKLYDRRKIEIRLSQIFVKLDSSKADFGEMKANAILDKALKGEKFEDLINQFSEDPGAKESKGDIYYVTAGEMNLPGLEDAIYETPVGKVVPKAFKSQNGFHILKVTDKTERVQGRKTSHIMALFSTSPKTAPDTVAARKKILEAMAELKSGVPFDSVAKKYSDDEMSGEKGGLIGVISRRQYLNVKEFEELVFNLPVNQISDILQTRFGFHIVKVSEIIPVPEFDKEAESLKKRYEQTGFTTDLDNYVAVLKTEMNYKLNNSLYNKLAAIKDSCLVGDSIFTANIQNKLKDSLLAVINNKPYTADGLFNFMINSSEIASRRYNEDLVKQSNHKFFASILLNLKAEKLLKNNPEFEAVMEDYKKGILLFRISEDEIWNKAKVDSNQVKQFWEETKNNYLTKAKATYREIYVLSALKKDSIYAALKSGADFDALLAKSEKAKSDIPKTKTIDEDILAKKAFELKNIGDISEPFSYTSGWSIVKLDKKDDIRAKTLQEAKPEVTAILQEKESKRLEENYIAKLKEMFKPKIYFDKVTF